MCQKKKIICTMPSAELNLFGRPCFATPAVISSLENSYLFYCSFLNLHTELYFTSSPFVSFLEGK
jgi:hypothetical protein